MPKPESRLRKKMVEAIAQRYPETLVFKIHGSPYQSAGMPDLIICRNGRFGGLEIKMPGKLPTDIQVAVGTAIRAAGGAWSWAQTVEEALQFVSSI